MAKRTIDDGSALAICRTPKPTPAKMRKVIAWANDNPSADKIQPLLILQTKNWASRKGLHDDFVTALSACSADAPEPLWDTVARDYDTYRVWHAIRRLAGRSDGALGRLIELGRTPLMGIHWSVIEDAAAARGVSIPDDVREARAPLVARQNVIDFYEVFAARRDSWPAELDPDPRLQKRKPVVLKATLDEAARQRAEALGHALAALEAALSEHDPATLDDWRQNQGATAEQLDRLRAASFGGKALPPELEVWFPWHLGAVHNHVELERDALFYPLDVDGVIGAHEQLVKGKQDGELLEPYRVSWLPLFADGAGDFLCLETAGARRGRLVEFFHDDDERPWVFNQLADWAVHAALSSTGAQPDKSERRQPQPPAPTPQPTQQWRFAIGDLPPLEPTAVLRSRADFDALPIGTAFSWERRSAGADAYLTVKLAPGCWISAATTSMADTNEAIVRLASEHPPLVWRDQPDGLFGVLRQRDLPRRTAHCDVRRID